MCSLISSALVFHSHSKLIDVHFVHVLLGQKVPNQRDRTSISAVRTPRNLVKLIPPYDPDSLVSDCVAFMLLHK